LSVTECHVTADSNLSQYQRSSAAAAVNQYRDVTCATQSVYLPPTKEEIHVFAPVHLSVCLSVSKITQKRVHEFG